MPGCAALGCSNRTETGHSLKAFPRDPKRRALWTTMVNRKNWTPRNSSYICEIHFDENQWEIPRVDGKMKLKANAVPTIFDFSLKKRPSSRKRRKVFNGKESCYEETDVKGQLQYNGPECLVCHNMLNNNDKVPAYSITATSGVTMNQRLRQITDTVSHKQWRSPKNGLLCSCCAQLINYVDKMESELSLLKGALAECILFKGGRSESTDEFVTNLLALDEFQSNLMEINMDKKRCHIQDKNQERVSIKKTGRSLDEEIFAEEANNGKQSKLEISIIKKEQFFQCKICSLKTNSQSVLLFHLRRHMANYQWCDFCDIPLISIEDSS